MPNKLEISHRSCLLEQRLEDSLAIYNCQACEQKAHRPVLTTCGHLFCWKCYYLEASKKGACTICTQPTSSNEVYPIFIEQESSEANDGSFPERPLPINKPKVPNADIIMPRSNHIKDNLRMGRMLAGNVLLAPLAITAYSAIEDPEEGDIEKSISLRLKYLFLLVLAMLIVLLAVYLFS